MSLRIFSDFSVFLPFFEVNFPELSVVFSNFEEDRFFIGDLLFRGITLSLDCETLTRERFLSETENYGLFIPETHLVLYKTELMQSGVDSLLLSYCQNPNPYVRLIIFISKKSQYELFLKNASKAVFLNLSAEKPYERDKRISLFFRRFLEKQGFEVSNDVLKEFMLLRSGMDKLSLFKELEKLVCFLGKKKVLEKKDLRLLKEEEPGGGIWELRDLIFKRKKNGVFFLLRYLILDKHEDPLGIIAFLRSQILIGLRIVSDNQLEDKRKSLFRNYGVPCLKRALIYLFYAEEHIKNGVKLPLVVMESLIFRLINESMVIA